jgi:hypothetical protein
LQGLTVGDGKLFDRVILSWDRKAESRWPGIFYVGSSRAMAAHNLALANPLSAEDLEAISRGPAWQAQKATVRSFERRARDTRNGLALRNESEWHSIHPLGSRYDFAQRLFRTHGPLIAASDSIPQYAKDEVSSALQQWRASLIQLGYTRYI